LQADRAGRVKGLSNLSLALTQIHTTDGQTVNIETTPWTKEGSTSKKRDAAEVAGGAALGAIIGAIAGGGKGAAIGAGAGGAAGTGAVLTTRGKAAEVPAETRVTFALSNNVPVTERLN
jgi:outer membrane lipoprotein SlyB